MSRHAIIGKSNMKQKFFSQISDQQQSVAPVPSRGCLIPPALLLVADLRVSANLSKNDRYNFVPVGFGWKTVIVSRRFFCSICEEVCQSFCKMVFHNVEVHETHTIAACIRLLR